MIKFDTHGNVKWVREFLKDLSPGVANQIMEEYEKDHKEELALSLVGLLVGQHVHGAYATIRLDEGTYWQA